MKFIKGDYVVLLSNCINEIDLWANCMPIDYVYRLRDDFDWNCFRVEKDLNSSTGNGWTISDTEENKESHGKMRVRFATSYEIEDYIRNNGPVKATQIRAYEIY